MTLPQMPPEGLLRALFGRAVEAADPMRSLAAHLPEKPQGGRVIVIGAGKASARMAEAVEAEWGPCEGLVITRYGYGRRLAGIELVEAAHPVPDAAGATATARMLDLVTSAGEGDFIIALISGGASALLVAPAEGLDLVAKQAINADLLASGAPISVMNAIRKHLSRVKGGQLAAAAFPARMLTLAISDIPGDDPGMIGSGPTVGESASANDALAALRGFDITLPAAALAALATSGVVAPDDPRLARAVTRVIAAPAQSLSAAADMARGLGVEVEMLGDSLEGEAREVAAAHAALALERRLTRDAAAPPLVILSGGELTVTRRGNGIGGPNVEYALALALALDGAAGIHAIACDTDGVDGAAEVAGAVIGPSTFDKARQRGIDLRAALDANDAHGVFGTIGDQVITGPTLTNVNDFRAILISGEA